MAAFEKLAVGEGEQIWKATGGTPQGFKEVTDPQLRRQMVRKRVRQARVAKNPLLARKLPPMKSEFELPAQHRPARPLGYSLNYPPKMEQGRL